MTGEVDGHSDPVIKVITTTGDDHLWCDLKECCSHWDERFSTKQIAQQRSKWGNTTLAQPV